MTFDKFSDMIFPVTKKGSFFCDPPKERIKYFFVFITTRYRT